MPKKPPSWKPPSLFPDDVDESLQHTEPVPLSEKGDPNAVQDHRASPPGAAPGDIRPASQAEAGAADNGALRPRTEEPAPGLEGNAHAGDTGQRPEPDRERGAGAGTEGPGGSFTQRFSSGRPGSVIPRPGNGVHPPSYVARVKASRGQQRSLFDLPPEPQGTKDTYPPA